MLKNDMVKYCGQVDELINGGTSSFPLNQNMYDALVSFDYNCGQGSLRSL
jgi:GH24 family phage-related lysozyme (muramidase)